MPASLQTAGDAALVVGIGRWNEAALAEVYRRHGGAVYGLARRVLGEDGAAQEITQEVFLRLWNDPDRFDADRGSLRSFLLADAHGRAVDRLRSDRARARREEREARQQATGGYDVEREVWDLTVAGRVREALNELSEGEKRAIQLAYFGGHTYRDVARLLDEPEGTVKSRIRTGLRRLRSQLVTAGLGEPWAER